MNWLIFIFMIVAVLAGLLKQDRKRTVPERNGARPSVPVPEEPSALYKYDFAQPAAAAGERDVAPLEITEVHGSLGPAESPGGPPEGESYSAFTAFDPGFTSEGDWIGQAEKEPARVKTEDELLAKAEAEFEAEYEPQAADMAYGHGLRWLSRPQGLVHAVLAVEILGRPGGWRSSSRLRPYPPRRPPARRIDEDRR